MGGESNRCITCSIHTLFLYFAPVFLCLSPFFLLFYPLLFSGLSISLFTPLLGLIFRLVRTISFLFSPFLFFLILSIIFLISHLSTFFLLCFIFHPSSFILGFILYHLVLSLGLVRSSLVRSGFVSRESNIRYDIYI